MSCSGRRGSTSISASVFPNRLRVYLIRTKDQRYITPQLCPSLEMTVFVYLCAALQFSDMCFGLGASSIGHLRLFTFWYFVTSLRKNPSPNKGKRRRAGLVIDVIGLATGVNALRSCSRLVGQARTLSVIGQSGARMSYISLL